MSKWTRRSIPVSYQGQSFCAVVSLKPDGIGIGSRHSRSAQSALLTAGIAIVTAGHSLEV